MSNIFRYDPWHSRLVWIAEVDGRFRVRAMFRPFFKLRCFIAQRLFKSGHYFKEAG